MIGQHPHGEFPPPAQPLEDRPAGGIGEGGKERVGGGRHSQSITWRVMNMSIEPALAVRKYPQAPPRRLDRGPQAPSGETTKERALDTPEQCCGVMSAGSHDEDRQHGLLCTPPAGDQRQPPRFSPAKGVALHCANCAQPSERVSPRSASLRAPAAPPGRARRKASSSTSAPPIVSTRSPTRSPPSPS